MYLPAPLEEDLSYSQLVHLKPGDLVRFGVPVGKAATALANHKHSLTAHHQKQLQNSAMVSRSDASSQSAPCAVQSS